MGRFGRGLSGVATRQGEPVRSATPTSLARLTQGKRDYRWSRAGANQGDLTAEAPETNRTDGGPVNCCRPACHVTEAKPTSAWKDNSQTDSGGNRKPEQASRERLELRRKTSPHASPDGLPDGSPPLPGLRTRLRELTRPVRAARAPWGLTRRGSTGRTAAAPQKGPSAATRAIGQESSAVPAAARGWLCSVNDD